MDWNFDLTGKNLAAESRIFIYTKAIYSEWGLLDQLELYKLGEMAVMDGPNWHSQILRWTGSRDKFPNIKAVVIINIDRAIYDWREFGNVIINTFPNIEYLVYSSNWCQDDDPTAFSDFLKITANIKYIVGADCQSNLVIPSSDFIKSFTPAEGIRVFNVGVSDSIAWIDNRSIPSGLGDKGHTNWPTLRETIWFPLQRNRKMLAKL